MANILGDIKTPYVNEATLKRIMSSRVKENIFQGIFTRPGEAVTEKFSDDTDAAQIQVIRIKPNTNDAREIGAATVVFRSMCMTSIIRSFGTAWDVLTETMVFSRLDTRMVAVTVRMG